MIAQSNYGDAITVEMHRWYAVIREHETVLKVIAISSPGEGLDTFDSVEEFEASL